MYKFGLFAALLLSGCASEMPRTLYHWTKAGGDSGAMTADWRDCVAANSASSRPVDGVTVRAEAVDPGRAVDCMKGRGWALTGSEAG